MPLWQRLLITLTAIVLSSLLASYLADTLLGLGLPGYVAGVVGGIVAVPVWELLKRVRTAGPPPDRSGRA